MTPETRLVTLTAGGNDIGYIGYLVQASLPALLRAITGTNRRLAALADPAEVARKAAALADDLIALFDAIRSRAPKAIIAVTDYLTLLPPESRVSAHPLTGEDAERGRQYSALVNLTIRQASARAGVLFAEVSAASAQHHAWSSEPWTERFVLLGGKAAPYHPNRAGMASVAAAVETALGSA